MNSIFFNNLSYYKWWKNLDKSILTFIITFFVIGLFFSLVSTSLIASDKLDTNSYFFFFKHLLFVLLGIIIIFIISFLEKNILYKISIYIFFTTLILLILVPIIGVEVKGSKRWIDLFFLPRFQPIEILKPFLIIILATIISNKSLTNLVTKFIFSLLLTLLVSFLLIIQPDLGQTLLITFSWLMLIFVSGVNLILLSSITIFVLTSLLYATFNVSKFEYIKNRLL